MGDCFCLLEQPAIDRPNVALEFRWENGPEGVKILQGKHFKAMPEDLAPEEAQQICSDFLYWNLQDS